MHMKDGRGDFADHQFFRGGAEEVVDETLDAGGRETGRDERRGEPQIAGDTARGKLDGIEGRTRMKLTKDAGLECLTWAGDGGMGGARNFTAGGRFLVGVTKAGRRLTRVLGVWTQPSGATVVVVVGGGGRGAAGVAAPASPGMSRELLIEGIGLTG